MSRVYDLELGKVTVTELVAHSAGMWEHLLGAAALMQAPRQGDST